MNSKMYTVSEQTGKVINVRCFLPSCSPVIDVSKLFFCLCQFLQLFTNEVIIETWKIVTQRRCDTVPVHKMSNEVSEDFVETTQSMLAPDEPFLSPHGCPDTLERQTHLSEGFQFWRALCLGFCKIIWLFSASRIIQADCNHHRY